MLYAHSNMAATKKQEKVLSALGIPSDLSSLTDDQWFDAESKLSSELQMRGISDGELNEYGKICDALLFELSQV